MSYGPVVCSAVNYICCHSYLYVQSWIQNVIYMSCFILIYVFDFFRFRSLYISPICSFPQYLWRHICLLIIITSQMISAYFFWLAYGTMALLLGPLRTWSAIVGLVLWYQAATAHKNLLRGAAQIWIPRQQSLEAEENDFTKNAGSVDDVTQSSL